MKYQIELDDTDCFFLYGFLNGERKKVHTISPQAAIILERIQKELMKSMKGHENDPLR